MTPVSPSRTVRLELERRMAGQFNDALIQACVEFGEADLQFAINFDQDVERPGNYFGFEAAVKDLEGQSDLDLPALAMWVGDAANQRFEMPRTFSGMVTAYWRFWLLVAISQDQLVALRECVEAAMVMVLDGEFTECGYRGDLAWRQTGGRELFGQDGAAFGWMQEVNFSAGFEVNL